MPQKDRTEYLEYQRKYFNIKGRGNNKKYRINLLNMVGELVCVQCGFSDYRALQIDHISGGGSRKRKDSSVLTQIKENPDNFQILCANCNWIKRAENNESTGRPKVF
jgi:RNase P subunit RPR2